MSEYMPEKLAEMTLKMIGDRWKVLIIQKNLEKNYLIWTVLRLNEVYILHKMTV